MLESVSSLIKILAEKSVGQLMLTIVIFFLIIMFAPDNLPEVIAAKSGIPYAMQILSFAVAFIISVILRILLLIAINRYPDYEQRGNTRKNKKINRIIDSLTKEERALLSNCILAERPFLYESLKCRAAKSLVEKGVLTPPSLSSVRNDRDSKQLPFDISPDYWPHLKRRYDVYSGEIK